MQDALRRYLQGVNDCDEPLTRSAITSDFFATSPGMGTVFYQRLRPTAAVCGANKAPFEVTAIARVLKAATEDVTIADGYFRTMGLPGGEKAGRAYVTFVRRDGQWRIMNLRFHSMQFEPPYKGVEPAAKHDSPGADGWITLFDGQSTAAFLDAGGGPFPGMWKLEDGALRAIAGERGRGLRTRDTYRSFELRFEWKAPPKGNSGVKYRLFFILDGQLGSDGTGFEYQIADDAGDPGAIKYPLERTGGLYNQIAPANAVPKPLGEFNESSIIVRGRHGEHWLNGVKVVEYDAESSPPEGPLILQHHGTDMWFRNLRIRRLE